jgi:hypothetical protein
MRFVCKGSTVLTCSIERASSRYGLRKRMRGDEDHKETDNDNDNDDQGNQSTDQSHETRPTKRRKVELLREIYDTEDHGSLEGGKGLELKQRQRGKRPTNQSPGMSNHVEAVERCTKVVPNVQRKPSNSYECCR